MKTVITLAFLTLSSLISKAQTTLPYYTGFDDQAQKSGWQLFKRGPAVPPVPNEWTYSIGAHSATECIYHGYPVGGTELTDNWFVSPGFEIPEGGTLDSIYTAFAGFGTPTVNDTVAVYLLVGNADPAQASERVLLIDYRDTLYNNDLQWRAIKDVPLPSRTATCYLGIRYSTVSNWLDVKFDDIHISSNSSTGIRKKNAPINVSVHPNPASGQILNIKTEDDIERYSIHNITGQHIRSGKFTRQLDISMIPAGSYILGLSKKGGTSTYPFIKE